MIINSKKKYVFVAVPKTATSTLHKILKHNLPNDHDYLQEKYHYPLSLIKQESSFSKDYFSFGFTRNPWDRFYSSWLEFTTRTDHLNTWSKDLLKFSTFEDFVLEFKESVWSTDMHFRPSSWYLYYENNPVDKICYYENFLEELKELDSTLNLDINFNKIPHVRKTNRNNDYKIYYKNSKIIDIVGDYYHEDIVNFGYNF